MTRRGILLCLAAAVNAAQSEERRVFDSVNSERGRRGRKPMVWNARLAETARQHSLRMARGGFFSHDDPRHGDLTERLQRAAISYAACAENIYTQSGGRDAVAAACAAWMKSSGHRANIVGKAYRETGVGVATTRSGAWFVTQIFLG